MSNINVLLGNRICRVLNEAYPQYSYTWNASKDILKCSFYATTQAGGSGYKTLTLNYFLTNYKSWIRNPCVAAEQAVWVSSYATEMEILRQDFLVNGWEA